MLFPKSLAKALDFVRYSFHYSLGQVIEAENLEGLELKAATVRLVLQSQTRFFEMYAEAVAPCAWSPIKGGNAMHMHGGTAAAYMLLLPLVINHHTGQAIGRNGALRVLTHWLATENGLIGARRRHLQQNWERYKGVCHLWAALRLFENLPRNDEDLRDFVSLAEALRRAGEAYVPRRSRDRLLNPSEMWTAPADFPLCAVNLKEAFDSITVPDEWRQLAINGGAG